MKKRLWWSMLLSSAALMIVTSVTAFADRPTVGITKGPGVGRAPDLTPQVPVRIPSNGPGGTLNAWEGLFSTNNLSTEQYLFTPNQADVAAGPQDIITITSRRIARYPNPNTVNLPNNVVPVAPAPYNPTNTALLDAWLGESLLNNLCPTQPRSNISCLIDHASVRYDQMQGRWVVLMTATDTGIQTLGSLPTQPRKASWVLAISNFATFNYGAVGGGSDLFIPPVPPVGATGGFNSANWSFYVGNSVTTLSPDGFGSNSNSSASAIGVGNINSIPGITGSGAMFDCNPAIVGTPAAATVACYFPTSARLGIDNDNLIIVSSVVNVNIAPTAATPGYAGNRVRVIKKTAVYTRKAALVFGNSLGTNAATVGAPSATAAAGGDYYDLFATTVTAGATVALNPTVNTVFQPFTLTPNMNTVTGVGALPVNAAFCEPAHVRGRPAASYTNSMVTQSGTQTSQNYIECIVSKDQPLTTNTIWIQPILYTPVNPVNPPANTNGAIPFFPSMIGDGTIPASGNGTVAGTSGTGLQAAIVDPFTNPPWVNQANYSTTPGTQCTPTALPTICPQAPPLYVGDNRPHRVIFREGHLYDARVAASQTDFRVDGARLSSTVMYDVLQKLNPVGGPGAVVNPVFRAQWYNGQFFAPEYDVPADVTVSGTVSPINTFQWLEKVFVSTTFPALTATDPRLAVQTTNDAAAAANCISSTSSPGVIAGVQNTGQAWPGLFDQHCGLDPYDTQLAFRDPVVGNITTTIPNTPVAPGVGVVAPSAGALPAISLATRGGASTDPNNGSLWNFGIYATRRFAGAPGAGQWASYASNYALAFPAVDPYNNSNQFYTDVPVNFPFFVQIQSARQLGLADPTQSAFGVGTPVLRAEMARLVMLSLMDEPAITNYLNSTGGCNNSFADVVSACVPPSPVTTPAAGPLPAVLVPTCTSTGVPAGCNAAGNPPQTSSFYWRYIEAMYRRGITKGCASTDDARRYFCGDQQLTRGQMSVFLVRAKFNNVFPTVLSGCPSPNIPTCGGGPGGDNFGLFVPTPGYFSDVPVSSDQFIYIQKMFELRITNGTGAPTLNADGTLATQGTYSPNAPITREQIMAFIVRAFFF